MKYRHITRYKDKLSSIAERHNRRSCRCTCVQDCLYTVSNSWFTVFAERVPDITELVLFKTTVVAQSKQPWSPCDHSSAFNVYSVIAGIAARQIV